MDPSARVLFKDTERSRLGERYIQISKEIIDLKSKLNAKNSELSRHEKDLKFLEITCDELRVKLRVAQSIENKFSDALAKSFVEKKNHEKAIKETYKEVEEAFNVCSKKFFDLSPKLTKLVELSLIHDVDKLEEDEKKAIIKKAKIDAMLFFNNSQIKLINQLHQAKEDEILAQLDTDNFIITE